MFLSNAFWVEVWGTPYFSLGSHFLFLLTLVPCCFPSEFVPLFRRLQSGWAASVVCSASAWPASDFSHSQRGQTYVKLFSFSMSSLKQSQSLSDSDSGLSPTPHKLAHSLQMLPGSVRELTSQEQLPNQWGAGGGGWTKTPAIIRQVDPSVRHLPPSQRFQWTWAFYAYRPQGNTPSKAKRLFLFPWFALPPPHFFLGSLSE